MKALGKNGACFAYLSKAFPRLSSEKLKAVIFDWTKIRQLIKDCTFSLNMTKVEQDAWNLYVLVVKVFLGRRRAQNYISLLKTIYLQSFRLLGHG